MNYSEREKQIAELRRQMMLLEEENKKEEEEQERIEIEKLMKKRREEGLPEIHFPKEERRFSMDYKNTFLEIKKIMDEQGIQQEYGEYSGYVFIGENDNCLRIMRGEKSKDGYQGYYSMVQFNNGPIRMIRRMYIEKASWGVEINFNVSDSCRYILIIDEDGWQLRGKPPMNKEIEEQIIEVRSICEWVKIIYHDTRDTARSLYEWNAHDYVTRDALEPDNGVEKIIDDDDDNDIRSIELWGRL